MSWENLEGKQESSHHSGDVYRNRVRDYLEAGEFHEIGDHYSGTSDIKLHRPADAEEKVFRVETKNTKVGRTNQDFIDEIARQFIVFSRGGTDFEFHVYAEDYAAPDKWKAIFHDRVRDEQTVQTYYERIRADHGLNPREAEQLEALEFDEFWRFLENVHVKKAGYERLGELIDDRESRERRNRKWEFYVRENESVDESGEVVPNCVRITNLPSFVWTVPSRVRSHHDFHDDNPDYLPVWLDGGDAYSLINPEEMQDSARQLLNTDEASRHEFSEWVGSDPERQRTAITLLNYQLLWRIAKEYDRCQVVKYRGTRKLIFEPGNQFDTTQQTLEGGEADKRWKEEVENYVVLMDMGTAIAHRYGEPRVKRYGDQYYAFLRTGWLFTRHGRGDVIVDGDEADDLHNKMNKNTRERVTNKRSQFRQWRGYFGAREAPGDAEFDTLDTADQSQRMALEAVSLALHVRPPANASERERLMEGERVE